jgi:hypothetical protein
MTASGDVAAVDRVLSALAQTPEESLAPLLDSLLPRLLAMLTADTGPALRGKLFETLGHVNKRVRERLTIALPLTALLAMLPGGASPRCAKPGGGGGA